MNQVTIDKILYSGIICKLDLDNIESNYVVENENKSKIKYHKVIEVKSLFFEHLNSKYYVFQQIPLKKEGLTDNLYIFKVKVENNFDIKFILETEAGSNNLTIQLVIHTLDKKIEKEELGDVLRILGNAYKDLANTVSFIRSIDKNNYYKKSTYAEVVKKEDHTFKVKHTNIYPSSFVYISLNNAEDIEIDNLSDENISNLIDLFKIKFKDHRINLKDIEGNILNNGDLIFTKKDFVLDSSNWSLPSVDITKNIMSQYVIFNNNTDDNLDKVTNRIKKYCLEEFDSIRKVFNVAYEDESDDIISMDTYFIGLARNLISKGNYLTTTDVELDIFNRMQSVLERMSMKKFHLINNFDDNYSDINMKIRNSKESLYESYRAKAIKIKDHEIEGLRLNILDVHNVSNLENQFNRIAIELENFKEYMEPNIQRKNLEIKRISEKSDKYLAIGITLVSLLALIPIIFGGMNVQDIVNNNSTFDAFRMFIKGFNEEYLITLQSTIGIVIAIFIAAVVIFKYIHAWYKKFREYENNMALYKTQELYYTVLDLNDVIGKYRKPGIIKQLEEDDGSHIELIKEQIKGLIKEHKEKIKKYRELIKKCKLLNEYHKGQREKIIEIRALSEYYKKHKEVIKEYKEEIKKHKEKIRKLIREYKEKIKELIKEHKELSEYHIELIESHDKKHMELYDLLSRAKMSDDGVYINFKDDAQLYSSETREKLLEKLYKKITKKEKNRNKMLNKVSNNKIMKKINKFRLNILEKDIFYNRSKVIEIEKLNAVYQLEIFYYLYELEQLYYLIYKETSSCSLYNYKGNVESYHNRISYMRGFA